jgi:hypothetical protein
MSGKPVAKEPIEALGQIALMGKQDLDFDIGSFGKV